MEGEDAFKNLLEESVLIEGQDYQREEEGKRISHLPDADMLDSFHHLKEGFHFIDISLSSKTAFAAAKTIRKNTKTNDEKTFLTSEYDLSGVSLVTEYRDEKK